MTDNKARTEDERWNERVPALTPRGLIIVRRASIIGELEVAALAATALILVAVAALAIGASRSRNSPLARVTAIAV